MPDPHLEGATREDLLAVAEEQKSIGDDALRVGAYETALKHLKVSEAHFAEALGHEHERVHATRTRLGVVQVRLKRYKSALTSFSKVGKARGGRSGVAPAMYVNQGLVFLKAASPTSALLCFERAFLSRDATHATAARALRAACRVQEALGDEVMLAQVLDELRVVLSSMRYLRRANLLDELRSEASMRRAESVHRRLDFDALP